MTGPKPREALICAECCFVDVGQGTCNIILLGNERAIVLDCGPRGITPVRVLRHFGVEEITALIVSHNDSDHYGGASHVIQSFPRRIQALYLLDDRPTKQNVFLSVVRRELDAGNLMNQPIRLEATFPRGTRIYTDESRRISVHVLFPWMLANIDAREARKPNETSGVLVLQCGERRIVFPGDLKYEGWRQLREGLRAPMRCDVLAVPHHGGALTESYQEDRHRWVYDEAIRAHHAIVSVGSVSSDRHPRPDHIHAICASGSALVCTQITNRCCDDLEALRPGLVPPLIPGASKPTVDYSQSGRSRHVACAGSVLVEVGPQEVRIHRLRQHQVAVAQLASLRTGHPLCVGCLNDRN